MMDMENKRPFRFSETDEHGNDKYLVYIADSSDTELMLESIDYIQKVLTLEQKHIVELKAQNRANFCFGCGKYLGFRGFCSDKCHNDYYDYLGKIAKGMERQTKNKTYKHSNRR